MAARVAVLAVWLVIAAAGVPGEACLAGDRDWVNRWFRQAVHRPAVRLRLVRNPNLRARHDAVGLTSQELATWHAILAGMRQLAPGPGDQPGSQDGRHRP